MNKVAIVTGASKGIGRGIAEELLRAGISLMATYYEPEEEVAPAITELQELANANGVKFISCRFDLSDMDGIKILFDRTEQELGLIDIFVANAGAHIPPKPLTAFTEKDFDLLCNANFKGNFFCVQECAKRMNEEGRIILISSSTVKYPVEGLSLYSSIKAALEMLVKTAVFEVADKKIRVNAIAPGVTDTDNAEEGLGQAFFEEIKRTTPLDRVGTPKDIGNIVRLLCSEEADWINGQIIVANGGGKY